jgi:hypothetical protein
MHALFGIRFHPYLTLLLRTRRRHYCATFVPLYQTARAVGLPATSSGGRLLSLSWDSRPSSRLVCRPLRAVAGGDLRRGLPRVVLDQQVTHGSRGWLTRSRSGPPPTRSRDRVARPGDPVGEILGPPPARFLGGADGHQICSIGRSRFVLPLPSPCTTNRLPPSSSAT